MDDNVMRVLQMLQDGKISASEAETLIAALRGETKGTTTTTTAAPETPETPAGKEDKHLFGSFEKIKKPNLDSLGDKISHAVSKVQPDKIVKRVQSQLRDLTRAGAHFGNTFSARVRTWTDGEDVRPTNEGSQPESSETIEKEFHLEAGAAVLVENPLGNVKVVGIESGPAVVVARRLVWNSHTDGLKSTAEKIEIAMHGTDSRLDIKISAPDLFREGTVDLELRVPRSVNARVSTHYGEVEIGELDGRTEAVTTTGELRLLDLGGDARGETMSGTIRLARIAGTATVASQSGDITAEDIRKGLAANTASGDVEAKGIEGGAVETKSVSGDVKVENVGSQAPLNITVESVSGDASLTNANGNIGIKAVSGDVNAEDIVATRLQAQTVSGDIALKLREVFSGTMQVNTVSGDVHILLKEGSNVRVSLSTSSGELRCEHDAHDVVAAGTLWTGQIGTGAGTLNVQTISGDTSIQRA